MFPSFFNRKGVPMVPNFTDNRTSPSSMTGFERGIRYENGNSDNSLESINELIAKDYIRRTLEKTEKDVRDIVYGDCFWRRIRTEKDFPGSGKYDYVLVRNEEKVRPIVHKVDDGIEKSGENAFYELRNGYKITHWSPVPGLINGHYI